MNRKTAILAGAIALTALVPSVASATDGEWCDGAGTIPCETTTTVPPPVDPCEEDEPCWDCSTMGNRQCGQPEIGTPVVIVREAPPAPVAAASPAFTG